MTSNNFELTSRQLESIAHNSGISVVGITDTSPLSDAKEALRAWQERDFAGEMAYMKREPEILSSLSDRQVGAACIASFAVRYDCRSVPERPHGFGRVARYAWGRDYHSLLPQRIEEVVRDVSTLIGRPISYKIFSDAVPLLERALAVRAGLGFIGKNSMLIRPKLGSFTLIGEVLWDVSVGPSLLETQKEGCGSCTKCIDKCPTGAIVSDYTVDARRCISYLTIEKRGAFSLEERAALGEWLFGCDLCQDVCPYNHTALKVDTEPTLSELSKENGVGPHLDLGEILRIRTSSEFENRFGGSAITRTRRAGLLRNAACVAVNTHAGVTAKDLELCAVEDASPVVRQHSLWAICSLYSKGIEFSKVSVDRHLDRARLDSDTLVRDEAARILSCE